MSASTREASASRCRPARARVTVGVVYWTLVIESGDWQWDVGEGEEKDGLCGGLRSRKTEGGLTLEFE